MNATTSRERCTGRTLRRVSPWYLVAVLMAISAGANALPAGSLPSLLTLHDEVLELPVSGAALDGHLARVHPEALVAPEIELELAAGQFVRLTSERIEWRGANATWIGTVDSNRDFPVMLTWFEGHLAGLVYTETGPFELVPLGPSRTAVVRLDQRRYPPCGSGTDPSAADAPPAWRAPDRPLDVTRTLDVLVVYTPEAVAGAGSAAALRTTIQAAVDQANAVFANSAMLTRFRLVGSAPVARHDSGDLALDLAWLRADPTVGLLRDEAGADMVSLLTEDGGGSCGRAYVLGVHSSPEGFASNAFQVTVRSCAVGNLSFVHEHGHNLGMQHNPENVANPENAIAPDAFGHREDGFFSTVMAYSSGCVGGCPRYPNFSNPEISLLGWPTGMANARDNHRVGDEMASIASSWRVLPALFADGFESGDAGAWGSLGP